MPAEPSAARRPASLALRVTALVGIATTLVFVAFNWGIVRALEHHFADQDASELRAVAEAVALPLRDARGADPAALEQRLAGAVGGHHGVFHFVADESGATLYAAGAGPDLARVAARSAPAERIDTHTLAVWQEDGRSYRGAVLRAQGANGRAYTIVVATDIGLHLAFLEDFERMLWWATAAALAIALLVVWLAVLWGHIPIRKVDARIRAISSSQLHVRLNPKEVPIELAQLVASFNAMLERIEEGFTRLSNFSADIAHELRTPITNLTTQTQVALGQPRTDAEYREILYSNLEEFERMSRMIGDMLFLAQTENDPGNLQRAPVDLAATVRGLFEYFEAWAEDRGVSLRLEGGADPVTGDADMLRRAIGNLLSNAVRYTPRGAAVTVRLAQDARDARIAVENPGPAIPPDDLPRLFDRFYRADPARQRKGEGAGLGLAIVKSIAEAHGGAVRAESDAALTRFTLSLPRAAV